MKHRNWIGCSRSLRKMTWRHLGFIMCYTGILIVVVLITDRYDADRLETNGELKGYKFDEIDTVVVMAKTHDIKMNSFEQQAKQTNELDNQMHSFNKLAKPTNNDIHSSDHHITPSDNSYPDVRATSKSGLTVPKTSSNPLMTHFQQEVRRFRKQTKGGPWTMDRIQEWFTITDDSTKDPMLNKHQYTLHQTSKVCNRRIDLLIVVHSTVNNFDRRRDIRLHWGSVLHFKNISIGTVFLLGESRDTHVNMKVSAEALENGDIVQGNFIDSYTNLTYKHVMALHWMTSQCNDVRTIVKVDDDVVIDIFKLASFSKSVGHYENTLYCSIFRRIPAIRDPRDKWYTPYGMYPFDMYPDYCEGFGYIMSIAEARLLYKASVETRFYWVDDVYVTGILRLRAGINIRGYTAQHSYTKMNRITHSREKDVMFYINYDEWQDVWLKIYSQKYRY